MEGVVIFDLDDTLVDSTEAVDRWFIELTEQRELGPEGLSYLRAEQRRPVTPSESFHAIVEHFGFSESPMELRHNFMERHPLLVRPFNHVTAGLNALREIGWLTALLTNGMELDQRRKMEGGLFELFDVVCFAEDEKMCKPDPAAFRRVTDQVCVEPGEAWMIGDSLECDIAGGIAVGMSTIWVSGGLPLPKIGPQPDAIVSSVGDVFPILLRDTRTTLTVNSG